ncbi:hypothetical protein ABIB95_005689 [Bradyrhizobium sp. LA2.1]
MAAREAKENEYNEYQIPCAAVAIATAMPAAAEDGETVTPYFNLAISNIPGKSLFAQFVDQCRGERRLRTPMQNRLSSSRTFYLEKSTHR